MPWRHLVRQKEMSRTSQEESNVSFSFLVSKRIFFAPSDPFPASTKAGKGDEPLEQQPLTLKHNEPYEIRLNYSFWVEWSEECCERILFSRWEKFTLFKNFPLINHSTFVRRCVENAPNEKESFALSPFPYRLFRVKESKKGKSLTS